MERRSDITQLLAQLESTLGELDRLHRDVTRQAEALVQAAGTAEPPRSVFSITEAAEVLGVSVSTVHKLLRERQLGHLKVGRRTLITAAHLEQLQCGTVVAR